MAKTVQQILKDEKPKELRALFLFNELTPVNEIAFKFGLFVRKLYPKFFTERDAPFHREIDKNNIETYLGQKHSFLNICFRNASKTTRTKLFVTFSILNDETKLRKYVKVLCRDSQNSKQFVTDIYNLLVTVRGLYPEIFEKTDVKREETMGSFTTSTGVKVTAGTVGSSQRGDIQDESRPDLLIFDDFEDRVTLRSAVITKAIWDNMEEARTGLSKEGSVIYLANYISELGNVQRLVDKIENRIIIPIEENGKPTWSYYTKDDLKRIKADAEDYAGEYLCKPDASKDVYFARDRLEEMKILIPIREVGGFKIYKEYNPSHRYAGGGDVAGGVQLDSSASVFIDFDTIPAQVVGTFYSNTIAPEAYGDECYNEAEIFGACLLAIENNKFDQAILKAKLLGATLYKTGGKELKIGPSKPLVYGWNTNALTKSKMFSGLRSGVEDGLLQLNDPDLIREAKAYTRNELIDNSVDPRLVTKHFDLLTACAIAWQMKDRARISRRKPRPIPVEGASFVFDAGNQRIYQQLNQANKENPAR